MNFFNLTPPDFACYAYCMDNRLDADTRPLLIRFPFPRGVKKGVRG
jgi:hypothetical protein